MIPVVDAEKIEAIVAEQAQVCRSLCQPIDVCEKVEHPVAEFMAQRMKPPVNDFTPV